jgi:membrane-associated phospholipid phosphatase
MSKPAITVYSLLILLFGVFCYFAHGYDYFALDLDITCWIQQMIFPGAEPLMRFAPYVLILAVLLSLKLWLPSRRREVAFIALTALAAGAITWLLKLIVNRPRPEFEPGQLGPIILGSDFPSGHTACVTVICGFLFYLAPRLVKTPALMWLLRALLTILIIFTGVSRIYLGAHWFSGVVGGLCLGGLVLYPAIVLYQKYGVKNA